MPTRFLVFLLLFCQTLFVYSGQPEAPIVVVKADEEYQYVKESVIQAIINRGLIVSGELHVSDMLSRTGQDLGFDRQVFAKAESIEFCSALVSHKMTHIDPTNLVICPFTIAVFVKTDEPDQVYVAFRRNVLAGEGAEVEHQIHTLLSDIVAEALE